MAKPLDPILAKAHADFIRPYLERDRKRAERKYNTADVIDFAAKTGIQPPDPSIVRAQFNAADPALKEFVKEAHQEGLIDGLRDITIYKSLEEADAAWDALRCYTLPAEKMHLHSDLFPFVPTKKL